MAQRRFVDSAGVQWTVWATIPSRPDAFADALRSGWLTFNSDIDRRRLVPIPGNWEDASIQRLELMCRAAEPTRRQSPPTGQPRVNEPGEP